MPTEIVQKKLAQLPKLPGIYKMLDAEGNILYIGKSKCLKQRVSSYFVTEPKWEKAKKMSPFIKDIDYIVTDTHLEAMLLECELIKKIRPYFNVSMKYDEKYVYLKLGKNLKEKPLEITPVKTECSFGPFRSKNRGEEFVTEMEKMYPLEKCKNGAYRFEYHIFPQSMNENVFLENQKVLNEIFSDSKKMERFIKKAEQKMQKEAGCQRYEMAVRYRDMAEGLRYMERAINRYKEMVSKDFIYTVPLESGYKMFYIRDGLVVQTKSVKESGEEQEKAFEKEVLENNFAPHKELSEKEKVDYRAILYTELEGDVS